MSHEEQTKFGPEMLLYGRHLRPLDLLKAGEAALGTGASDLRVSLFVLEGHPVEALEQAVHESHVRYRQISTDPDHLSAHISGTYGRIHVRELEGRFNAIRHPDYPKIWLMLSHENLEFFKKPLRDLLRGARPRFVRPILRTPQIHNLFNALRGRKKISGVRIRQLGLRGRIASQGADRRVERDRRWTDLQVDEAFEEAIQSGQWVSDATAEYKVDDRFAARLTITRSGSFRFQRRFADAAMQVIDLAAGYAIRWYRFLQDRDRTEETLYRSRPFRVDFGYPVLAEKDQIGRLSDALGRIPHTTFTVLHGNPFFHAVMVDYFDGSTAEVLVVDESSIVVLPQGRSTVNSLRRICARVFSDFREGELKDAF